MKAVLDGREIEASAVAVDQQQVVQPDVDRVLATGDLVGAFLENLEAKVLQHRQAVGQRLGRARVIDLEANSMVSRLDGPVHIERQLAVAGHGLDFLDIDPRLARRECLAVAAFERSAVNGKQAFAVFRTPAVGQNFKQIVVPGARRGDQPCFDLTDVGRGHVAVAIAMLDDEVNAGERRITDFGRGPGDLAGEGVFDNRLEPSAQRGRMDFAGDEHEARRITAELFAPGEQFDAWALQQMQDAERELGKLFFRDLEQLVTRKRLQNVNQRFAVVADRREPGLFDGPNHFAPEKRNVARAAVVGRRREQADETVFAGERAILGEPFDADVVHMAGPVNVGPPGRLRNHDGRGDAFQEAVFLAASAAGAGENVDIGVAQNTEAGAVDHTKRRGLASLVEGVFAVAKKRKVVVANPRKKSVRFGKFRFLRRVAPPVRKSRRRALPAPGASPRPPRERRRGRVQSAPEAQPSHRRTVRQSRNASTIPRRSHRRHRRGRQARGICPRRRGARATPDGQSAEPRGRVGRVRQASNRGGRACCQ